MSYYKRFSNLFSHIKIELAHSLPILTSDKEIVFFYEERDTQEHIRKLGKIINVAYKRIRDGKEVMFDASEIVPVEISDKIEGSIINDSLSIEEDLEKEDHYISIYNQVYSKANEDSLTKEELNRLFSELKKAINFDSLYKLYEFLYNFSFSE